MKNTKIGIPSQLAEVRSLYLPNARGVIYNWDKIYSIK